MRTTTVITIRRPLPVTLYRQVETISKTPRRRLFMGRVMHITRPLVATRSVVDHSHGLARRAITLKVPEAGTAVGPCRWRISVVGRSSSTWENLASRRD